MFLYEYGYGGGIISCDKILHIDKERDSDTLAFCREVMGQLLSHAECEALLLDMSGECGEQLARHLFEAINILMKKTCMIKSGGGLWSPMVVM